MTCSLLFFEMEVLLSLDDLKQSIGKNELQIWGSQAYLKSLSGKDKSNFERVLRRDQRQIIATWGKPEEVLVETNEFLANELKMLFDQDLSPEQITFYRNHRQLIFRSPRGLAVMQRVQVSIENWEEID